MLIDPGGITVPARPTYTAPNWLSISVSSGWVASQDSSIASASSIFPCRMMSVLRNNKVLLEGFSLCALRSSGSASSSLPSLSAIHPWQDQVVAPTIARGKLCDLGTGLFELVLQHQRLE